MMLGYLLARAGVRVTVLEKHDDFLRDFRGDTIHPSTLEVIGELGLLDAFLRLPHTRVSQLFGEVFGTRVPIADFSHLPTHCRFIALMPQWDFLDFLADHGRKLPGFRLLMGHEAIGVHRTNGMVRGVTARSSAGETRIEADLVVGADGRRSTIRRESGLPLIDFGAPIDVLWFRLPKDRNDHNDTGGFVWPGLFFVTLDRGDYWQCAYVIRKGGAAAVLQAGVPALRERIARRIPALADNLRALGEPDQLKLLEVQVNRLARWYVPGLLCIGDAAHAMSPVGGVGVNLAIQDAVAAARMLAGPLRDGRLNEAHLAAVQRRREFPTRLIQRIQVLVQDRVIGAVLDSRDGDAKLPGLPLPLRLLQRFPALRRIPARLVGVGVRPEHLG